MVVCGVNSEYHKPDCVAGGALLAEAGAAGVVAGPALGSEAGLASAWFFFLRPKRPRRLFLIWATASGATNQLIVSKRASIAR